MTDLDRLDALAGAATPGPWRATAEMRNGWSGVYLSAPGSAPVFLTNSIEGSDRDFIAACDPDTLRELVAAVRERDELRAAVEALFYDGTDKPYAYPDRDRHHMMIPLRDPTGRPIDLWPNLCAALHREAGA